MPLTDHKAVCCDIVTTKNNNGPSYWKFNNSVLKDKIYVDLINDNLDMVAQEFKDILNPQCLWDYCKVIVKDMTKAYCTRKGMMQINELGSLQSELDNASRLLSLNPDDDVLANKVNILQNELDIKHLYQCKGAQIRSKQQWIQEGERNSKYFMRLEKARG